MAKEMTKQVNFLPPLILISISLLFLSVDLFARTMSFQGQFSGWLNYKENAAPNISIGLRYLPELRISQLLTKGKNIDAEIAVNSQGSAPVDALNNFADNSETKLYRLWLRYYTAQFEARFGLQKINFGPAKIMRSLIWFDKLDPQDPFKLTEGVYGLLTRYYFLNNSNLWFWGLFGNTSLKGLEFVKTDKERVEFGGRYQVPLHKGELALSYNQRYVDRTEWNRKMSSLLSDGLENRYALDGIWDIGIGLWFESVLGEIKIGKNEKMWRQFFTIGGDYTFQSGIHLLLEHFLQLSGEKTDKMNEISKISTLSLDYKISIIDSINAIGYYDWKNEKIYSYLGWQRTYDNWQVNLLAFSNREESSSGFSGKGVQCIITYNH